jgi:hypothetical protein
MNIKDAYDKGFDDRLRDVMVKAGSTDEESAEEADMLERVLGISGSQEAV